MVLDIIALVIIVFCLYSGMKKGFVKSLFSTASFILALVLTLSTVNPAFRYIKETDFGKAIYEKTTINFVETNKEEREEKDILASIIDTDKIIESADSIEENLSLDIGNLILRSLCSVTLFLAYTVILKLLANILDTIFKLPVLNAFNKLGGILAGGINAYIFMVVITGIIMLLVSTSFGETLLSQLDESKIAVWFYKNNPLF